MSKIKGQAPSAAASKSLGEDISLAMVQAWESFGPSSGQLPLYRPNTGSVAADPTRICGQVGPWLSLISTGNSKELILSSIVKFFVASPEEASSSMVHGPSALLRLIDFGNFDVGEALLDWESYLTGVSVDQLMEADIPELVAEDGEGPVVLILSNALSESLDSASNAQVSEMAKWWVDKKSQEGFLIDLAVALEIFDGLLWLIESARSSNEKVYCWVA